MEKKNRTQSRQLDKATIIIRHGISARVSLIGDCKDLMVRAKERLLRMVMRAGHGKDH